MSRGTFVRFAVVFILLLIIGGTVFIAYYLSLHEELTDITVNLDSEDPQVIKFEDLSLYPGAQTEFTLSLETKEQGYYAIYFSFCENEDLTLKNFAHVKLECEGEVIYDQLLKDALDETYIQFDKKLNEGESVLVKVIYYMPETVGNEAQNAEANFDLRISSRHK